MINGLIIVRKEKGYTSNDVVQILRGILKQKKRQLQKSLLNQKIRNPV